MLRDPSTASATKRHANYYMAQVHEYLGNWTIMAEFLDDCGLPFGLDRDDYDYFTHKLWADDFGIKQ